MLKSVLLMSKALLLQQKSKKIRIYKYKAKHNERKTIGHRQPYTCLVVEAINA